MHVPIGYDGIARAQALQIDDAKLSLTPSTVMPSTPFVASLEGTFSRTCMLGAGVVTGSYSNDGFEIRFRTANPGTDCEGNTPTVGAAMMFPLMFISMTMGW